MLPLSGKTILVTRGESQAGPLIQAIEEKGGEAILTPLISFKAKDTYENQQILNKLHDYSWVFFTSSNGVKFFFSLLEKRGGSIHDNLRFAVVGKKTAKTLKSFGYKADFTPSSYKASAMGPEFFHTFQEPSPILYVRGNRSRDELIAMFHKQQVFFQTMTAYDTLLLKDQQQDIDQLLKNGQLDALTFTSPSTVEAFSKVATLNEALILPCFCIGPTTAEQAESVGFRHIHTPETFTVEHLVERISQYFREKGER
ncbi:uroporphyrinogen-III synthase [Halobacillus litoralis]|uniref:uroporphyrinogen-III synthase n=1 Tax=Halobacillus litoralis TaxID=45668 RepID=UPI001CD416E3|nr:uroporphyrinogen-III synthase [Halobacillus litoralis]MCA0969911.1 uroporphyrinogen-III synthase [Halobacillus litoralis]